MPIPRDLQDLIGPQSTPESRRGAARALADLDGNLGETWVFADGQTLHLGSKRVGATFKHLAIPFERIATLETEDDRPFILLHIGLHDGTDYRLKFASHDRDRLAPLLALHAIQGVATAAGNAVLPQIPPPVPAAPAAASAATPPPVPDGQAGHAAPLDPLLPFCAALQMLVRADGIIEASEMHLVHRALANTELVARGIEYLQTHDFEALVRDCNAAMNGNQKLCLMANLLEIAMSDGSLRKEERHLITAFRERLEITEDNYKAIYDILLIKNDLGVLSR